MDDTNATPSLGMTDDVTQPEEPKLVVGRKIFSHWGSKKPMNHKRADQARRRRKVAKASRRKQRK